MNWKWNGLSWQLETDSGIKVWLVRRSDLSWSLDVGDMNNERLPDYLDDDAAKRMALGKVIGYLRGMISQIEQLRRV